MSERILARDLDPGRDVWHGMKIEAVTDATATNRAYIYVRPDGQEYTLPADYDVTDEVRRGPEMESRVVTLPKEVWEWAMNLARLPSRLGSLVIENPFWKAIRESEVAE